MACPHFSDESSVVILQPEEVIQICFPYGLEKGKLPPELSGQFGTLNHLEVCMDLCFRPPIDQNIKLEWSKLKTNINTYLDVSLMRHIGHT
ncbi:hypothetical protein GDO81_029462 [Engystomops pustulosus]|uniref:Uncharacterized protein n=1 Tax=Engystomops pustulosus TaxID=76066 RepID=A0AAV6YHM4_ENGPU|nr:hypothetical protein GDO81_029462 [Engystomops pustulosus]